MHDVDSSSIGSEEQSVSAHTVPAAQLDIAHSVSQSPVQPKLIRYPNTMFGNKPRSFSSRWYSKYTWLEYSCSRNAVFCYACRLFSGPGMGRAEETFKSIGYCDWKHATGKHGLLEKHDKCRAHKVAMVAWGSYERNQQQGLTIEHRLDSARSIQIQRNRHYIKTVAEVIILCARQDLALRGHDESQSSQNRGNFLEILYLIAQHDEIIKDRLSIVGFRNATYTSPAIQNIMLNVLGNIVRKTICSNVQNAKFFSILADETKDTSKKEQLSIVLRYVDVKACIHEHFLTYVEAIDLTAEGLSNLILNTLGEYQLDCNLLVSQGYDGASVMSGRCSGVQQRIQRKAPQAIYIHCYAHVLNLVLVDSVKGNQSARELFVLLELLYVFMSSSKAHVIFMEKQKALS